MSTPAECKAKDPKTCPYHGAVMEMYEAQSNGDFATYFKARSIVELKESNGWDENNVTLADDKIRSFFSELVNAPELDEPTVGSTLNSEVQDGKILDVVDVYDSLDPMTGEALRFYRRREGVWGSAPYNIRIQANRKLSSEDIKKMASLLGYQYKVSVVGESLGWPVVDTPYSFYVSADTTKSRRDDLGMALEEFEGGLGNAFNNGSPLRKRDNKRAIEGFNEDDLKFEIYYDDVIQ